jgi:3-hydroxyacyl-CoA dehydrogenase
MKEDIKRIAVVGAGTMGQGIAQSFAQAGYQVSMMSWTQRTLDRALSLNRIQPDGHGSRRDL